MSHLGRRFMSVLFSTDPNATLSSEIVRNEEARLKLASARIEHHEREMEHESKLKALDDQIKEKREQYAKQANPLLEEFNGVAVAEHYYDEIKNFFLSQHSMAERLAKEELGNFAYISKKLISVSLNFEAFRQKLRSGRPFRKELQAVLDDAESQDLNFISTPLFAFAEDGVPRSEIVRAAAFNLAHAIEEMGKTPMQDPVRGWLDFLKFRTTFSPTTLQMNETLARGKAQVFMRHINLAEYPKALNVADEVFHNMSKEKDATYDSFLATYRSFRKAIFPHIAADIFNMYAQSSLNDSRFACVESMLKA
ncbi:unnamed protein product [Phytomonas sp. EM1]|nr:unnamed protein product [Phytomonas sp. EM1]|eukprot:CCW59867.1 unnamed protein product [Phytomonas sp. isolate EM1]